jgi:hypothetical protein
MRYAFLPIEGLELSADELASEQRLFASRIIPAIGCGLLAVTRECGDLFDTVWANRLASQTECDEFLAAFV